MEVREEAWGVEVAKDAAWGVEVDKEAAEGSVRRLAYSDRQFVVDV